MIVERSKYDLETVIVRLIVYFLALGSVHLVIISNIRKLSNIVFQHYILNDLKP